MIETPHTISCTSAAHFSRTSSEPADHCEALQLAASNDGAQRWRLVQEHPSVSLIPPVCTVGTYDRHSNQSREDSQPLICFLTNPYIYRALFRVTDLKKEFRMTARAVKTPETIIKLLTAKPKLTYKTIADKRALSQTGKKLKAAKGAFEQQILARAQSECLHICEFTFVALPPRELRNTVYAYLIKENNATFYEGEGHTIKVVNGCSATQHYFDAKFTGPSMHADILDELNHRGIRFDFRRRHALLSQVFNEYKSVYAYDFASHVKNLGLTLNTNDIKRRKQVFESFHELFKLQKGTNITIFVEVSGKTVSHVSRSFRRIARVFVPFLGRLKQAGYNVFIVMNPCYVQSAVKNDAHSRFSTIPEQRFSYSFTLNEGEFSSTGIEVKLDRVCFDPGPNDRLS
jgi:hypothetical protein